MDPKDRSNQKPKIIYIKMDNNSTPELDPEFIRQLTEFLSKLDPESVPVDYDGDQEPSELDELEFLDALVQGDEQPEALKMIMDAFHKNSGRTSK